MKKDWQVVIIDSTPTSMLGTKLILEEQDDLRVAGMTTSYPEGLQLVKAHQPDLVLMDYRMPEGTAEELVQHMKTWSPSSHVIMFTDDDGLKNLQVLIDLGVSGVLSKLITPAQLMLQINALREGFAFVPFDWYRKAIWPASADELEEVDYELTDTETFIMDRIVQGITYDKIANEIDVSRRSIDNYLRKIYVKLGVSTRAQAIEKYALYVRRNNPLYRQA